MQHDQMQRVSKKNPCPICRRGDWCLISSDKTAAICPRTPEGAVKEIPNSGYLHYLVDRPKNRQYHSQRRFVVGQENRSDKDFLALQRQYSHQITGKQVNTLSQQLGVSAQSLKQLRIGWDRQAFTFPMSDFQGRIIGLRRRFPNGRKISLIDSKTGLFIPIDLEDTGTLLITEGPTDCAAALDLGFSTIGRPSCNSCVDMTARFAKGRKAVIVGDNDKPGKAGAEKLANILVLHCSCVKIIYPRNETKDLRQWLRSGLTHEQLQQVIDETNQLRIKISFKD